MSSASDCKNDNELFKSDDKPSGFATFGSKSMINKEMVIQYDPNVKNKREF